MPENSWSENNIEKSMQIIILFFCNDHDGYGKTQQGVSC